MSCGGETGIGRGLTFIPFVDSVSPSVTWGVKNLCVPLQLCSLHWEGKRDHRREPISAKKEKERERERKGEEGNSLPWRLGSGPRHSHQACYGVGGWVLSSRAPPRRSSSLPCLTLFLIHLLCPSLQLLLTLTHLSLFLYLLSPPPTQALSSCPSVPFLAAPGSGIETDTAPGRQKMYGPRGREGGAGGCERRGRETA